MTSNGRLELRNAGKFWKSIIAKQTSHLSMQLHLFFTHIAGQSISELRGLKSAKNQQFGESESFGLNTAKIFLHHVQRMGFEFTMLKSKDSGWISIACCRCGKEIFQTIQRRWVWRLLLAGLAWYGSDASCILVEPGWTAEAVAKIVINGDWHSLHTSHEWWARASVFWWPSHSILGKSKDGSRDFRDMWVLEAFEAEFFRLGF